MNWKERISIANEKLVVTGTRAPVMEILGSLYGKKSEKEACRKYHITANDIKAVRAFADYYLGR